MKHCFPNLVTSKAKISEKQLLDKPLSRTDLLCCFCGATFHDPNENERHLTEGSCVCIQYCRPASLSLRAGWVLKHVANVILSAIVLSHNELSGSKHGTSCFTRTKREERSRSEHATMVVVLVVVRVLFRREKKSDEQETVRVPPTRHFQKNEF